MIESIKRSVMAFAAVVLIAVAVSACGGGGPTTNGGGGDGGGDNGGGDGTGTPTEVDLSRISSGFMAAAGTIRIMAGESEVHGDIAFDCATGGDDCVVMVTVENGRVTATSTGGTVTATNSDTYNTRIRVSNEATANSIHAATGIDLLIRDDPLVLTRTIAFDSGSDYVGLFQSDAPPEGTFGRFSYAVPWVTRTSNEEEVHFEISVGSGLSQSELDPLAWLGRGISTTDISDYSEDESHGLGDDWRMFDAERDYDRAGALTVRVATDVHNAGTVARTYVGYGDFDRTIELSEADVPALPPDRSWQGVNVVGGVTGSLDGVPGRFSCELGVSYCWLETSRNADAEGYYPYPEVVFTRDDNGASEGLAAANRSRAVPRADYLVFGTWQYAPDDVTASDDYEFGVFAGGGYPFRLLETATDLVGTATYNGSAHGLYYAGRSSNTPVVGSFDARVILEADFGNFESMPVLEEDDFESMADTVHYGRLSGTVNSIRYSGSAQGFPSQLMLSGYDAPEEAIDGIIFYDTDSEFNTELSAVGVVTDGWPAESWAGTWQAMFFGYGALLSDLPTGVAGTFGATNLTDGQDGLVGAFGARREP